MIMICYPMMITMDILIYKDCQVNTEQSVERPWEPTGITIQVKKIF